MTRTIGDAAEVCLVGPATSPLLDPGQDGRTDDRREIELLGDFIDRIPLGVLRFAADGRVHKTNPAARAMLSGLAGNNGIGNVYDVFAASFAALRETVAAFARPSGTIVDQRRIDVPGLRPAVVLSLTIFRLTPEVYMGVVRDITKLTNMLSYAFAASDLLMDVNQDGGIDWAGGAFQSLLGMRPQEAVGQQLADLISPRDRDSLARAMLVLAARGRLPPVLMRLGNAAESRCVLAGLRMEGTAGRSLLTIGPPPTSQVSAEPAVRPSSAFAQEVQNWMRSGQAGTLELIDITGWDRRAAGLDNEAVAELQRSLGELAAAAGPDVVVGDFGGGRFGMMAGSAAELSDCSAALDALMGRFLQGGQGGIGRTQLELEAGTLAVNQAVQALRLVLSRFASAGGAGAAAAGAGGGLCGIIAHAQGQQRNLSASISDGRFSMVYQPIVSLLDRSLHHYEALIRPAANQPVPGNPEEFVTLAETVGLSRELDLAVMRRVVAQLKECPHDIAVNVSGLSIANPVFTDRFLAKAAALPKGRLLVELTETAEIEDLAAASVQIDRLRAAHIRVCLDDFGAGSASFRYLRALRVDFVKIDGSYVQSASQGEQGKAFVRAMRDLAATSGAAAIAERIETEADAALMRELGVSYGQGWLFGRPGPMVVETKKPVRWKY